MADGENPNVELVYQLRRIGQELDQLGSTFAVRNALHPTDLRALTLLLDAGRAGVYATPGWLSEQLPMNSAGVSSLLKRLERLGFIKRFPDTQDKRKVRIVVDVRAEKLGQEFYGPVLGDVLARLDGFTERDLKTVRRFLDTVQESLGNSGRSA